MSKAKFYRNTEEIIERLIQVESVSGCWLWIGARLKTGYGRIKLKGQEYKAHRWVYEQLRAPIPPGLVLRHTCDNPPCVNPAHLLPGTCADNTADAKARNRLAAGDRHWTRSGARQALRGTAHGMAKLNFAKAEEIRRRFREGENRNALARAFGVNWTTVSHIVQGLRWTTDESSA